ncbi:hypothetical protein MPAN_013210 [Mariniplasma anaerobium]|uniref:Uncharacterized protein n=1 Tax=Mariniplasma anaerobium TaxID=2735436 RepID=A0A7R7V8J5_9MOLU|nr:hypothetical protein MPAN_013210 [Mariniplasma anaerobium]
MTSSIKKYGYFQDRAIALEYNYGQGHQWLFFVEKGENKNEKVLISIEYWIYFNLSKWMFKQFKCF